MKWLSKRFKEGFHSYVFFVIMISFVVAVLLGFFFFVELLGAKDDVDFYIVGLMLGGIIVWFYKESQRK